MFINYLGRKHQYGVCDCITLIKEFYTVELNLPFSLPDYPSNRHWFKTFSTDSVDEWASKYSKKVSLTDIQNYDLIVFKSEKSNLVIHFGLYIAPNKMLHVEEGSVSRLDNITDYWLSRLYAIYRYNELV